MVRIGPMARAIFPLSRRELMAGLGAVAFSPVWPAPIKAEPAPTLELRARTDARPLRPSAVDALFWSFPESIIRASDPTLVFEVGRIKRGASPDSLS